MCKTFLLLFPWLLCAGHSFAQNNVSFKVSELHLDKTLSLTANPISEDDPGDLPEAYSFVAMYDPAQSKSRVELHFPAHAGTYHWEQQDDNDKNDSLQAFFDYDTNPQVYGNVMSAYPKEFTIHVTRYDNAVKGTVEGTYSGTMEANIPGTHQSATIPVHGSFRTVRTGAGTVCRKKRRDENMVTARALDILQRSLLARLKDAGWQPQDVITGEQSNIANHPGPFRPLMYCSDFFAANFEVDPHSALGKQLTDSMQYYSDQASKHSGNDQLLVKYTEAMFRFRARQEVKVNVDVNPPYLQQPASLGNHDRFVTLHVPHAAYAFAIVRSSGEAAENDVAHVKVLLGNWAGAEMNAKRYVTYPFKHKEHAAALETIIVSFHGDEEAIRSMIQDIDWEQMNDMLVN